MHHVGLTVTNLDVARHFFVLTRSSAKRITAVIPYFGYARQDRKCEPRVPITSKLVADLLHTAGTDRVLTIDLHAGQIQGFFNIPVDHLFAINVLISYIKNLKLPNLVVISPDAGGVERARAYAKRLQTALAIVDKRRDGINVAKAMNIIGDVKGKVAVIVDDMIDTAGTLMEATSALLDAGASTTDGGGVASEGDASESTTGVGPCACTQLKPIVWRPTVGMIFLVVTLMTGRRRAQAGGRGQNAL